MKSQYSLKETVYNVSLNSKFPFSRLKKVVGAGYKLYRSEYKIETYKIPYIILENVVITARASFQWVKRMDYLK